MSFFVLEKEETSFSSRVANFLLLFQTFLNLFRAWILKFEWKWHQKDVKEGQVQIKSAIKWAQVQKSNKKDNERNENLTLN